MKPRIKILLWLTTSLLSFVAFESLYQYHWRARVPHAELNLLRELADTQHTSVGKPSLTVINFGKFVGDDVPGFRTTVRFPPATDEFRAMQHVRDICCAGIRGDCSDAVASLSRSMSGDLSFSLLFDAACGSTLNVAHDHVGFASSVSADFLTQWASIKPNAFSGLFAKPAPLSILRFLLVESMGDNGARIAWSPESVVDPILAGMFAKLSPSMEVVVDTNTVYSANGDVIVDAVTNADPYERSRIINAELAEWAAPPHLLEFGVYSMPPLKTIAVVAVPPTGEVQSGTFDITDWVTLNVVPSDAVFNCTESVCNVTFTGGSLLQSTLVSVVRSWLGLPSESCLGDDSCRDTGLSTTEAIHLNAMMVKVNTQTIIDNTQKQINVLSSLGRLRFEQEVSDLTLEAVQLGIACIRADSLDDAAALCKLGAAKSAEALHHESIVAPPHFSNEFFFALYGPIGLPILVPVLSGLLGEYRRRRGVVEKTKLA